MRKEGGWEVGTGRKARRRGQRWPRGEVWFGRSLTAVLSLTFMYEHRLNCGLDAVICCARLICVARCENRD